MTLKYSTGYTEKGKPNGVILIPPNKITTIDELKKAVFEIISTNTLTEKKITFKETVDIADNIKIEYYMKEAVNEETRKTKKIELNIKGQELLILWGE